MKKNLSSYFFKKAFSHYSLGKMLLCGLLAVSMTGTVIGGTLAATSVAASGSSSVPTSILTAPAEPTPKPTPNFSWLGTDWKEDHIDSVDEPLPDVEVRMDLSGSQQNLGVALFALQEDESGNIKEVPLKNVEVQVTIVCRSLTELENEDNLEKHIISKVEGISKYVINEKTGAMLLEGVDPGVYQISVSDVEGYVMPEKQNVTVTERISYEQVEVETEEDEAGKGEEEPGAGAPPPADPTPEPQPDPTPQPTSTPIPNGPVIGYVSTDNGQGGETIKVTQQAYTSDIIKTWVDSNGSHYLYYKDGTPSAYKVTYAQDYAGVQYISSANWEQSVVDNGEWAAVASKAANVASASQTSYWASSALKNLANPVLSFVLLNDDTSSPTPEENLPAATAEPTATQTPEPTGTPTPAATATPTATPTAEPTATQTPEVTATAEPTPTVAPTAEPTLPTPTPPTQTSISFADSGFGTAQQIFDLPAANTIVLKQLLSGWQVIDGAKYYYHPNNNEKVTGSVTIDNQTYMFDSNGVLLTSDSSKVIGIDVSKWQPSIDWNAVKASGVEFVIIRIGYRGYGTGKIVEDYLFHSHITGAKAAGLRVGVYFFSQAINAEEGREEASAVLSILQKYGLSVDYPIYIDTELSGAAGNVGRADNITNVARTDAVVAFCETIKNAGYAAGIYASESWFYTKLNYSSISHYSLWNAKWGDSQGMNCDLWQYTATGSVPGIAGGVDMNISYIG